MYNIRIYIDRFTFVLVFVCTVIYAVFFRVSVRVLRFVFLFWFVLVVERSVFLWSLVALEILGFVWKECVFFGFGLAFWLG